MTQAVTVLNCYGFKKGGGEHLPRLILNTEPLPDQAGGTGRRFAALAQPAGPRRGLLTDLGNGEVGEEEGMERMPPVLGQCGLVAADLERLV